MLGLKFRKLSRISAGHSDCFLIFGCFSFSFNPVDTRSKQRGGEKKERDDDDNEERRRKQKSQQKI